MVDKTTQQMDQRLYIRSINEQGEIEGYICIWGDPEHRDSYDTWFDRAAPPDMALDFLPQPMYLEHGADETVGKARIGKVVSAWADKVGIKFRGLLDKSSKYFAQIVDEIKQGVLATSSGTAGHLAEFDDMGRFVSWPLVDLSLTKTPAESNMPLVSLVRSKEGRMYAEFSPTLVTSNDIAQGTGGDLGGGTAVHAEDRGVTEGASAVIAKPISTRSKRGMLTLEQLGVAPGASIDEVWKALVAMVGPKAAAAMFDEMTGEPPAVDDPNADPNATPAMMSAESGRSKKPAAPAKPAEDPAIVALRAQVDELNKKLMTEPPAPQTPPVRTTETRISLGEELKYAGKSHRDMEFSYLVMRSRNITPSEGFMRSFSGKVADAIEKGDKSLSNPAVRSKLNGATRSNEIAISTASGGGDEWVSVDYAVEPWAATRNETTLIDQLIAKGMMVKEVPQGAESTQIPTEGADPTVYTIAQSANLSSSRPPVNIAATRIGTGSKTLTPGELGAAVVWSDVFNEDSIVNVSSQYNFQVTTKLQETVVQLWINGDTDPTASTNINLIDGTPGTGTSTPYYIASNGALKYALVTGTSTSRDGGALDENDYRLTLKLMSAPTRSKLSQLIFVIDPDTHSASLDIAAIKTEDVKRTNATITSGVLTNIYGIDVTQTGFMALANSSGKIPAAGGTLGRIVCAFAPYWAMGWKRHITIETDRDILTGDNILVAKMRVGFVVRGADGATVSYDLTV